MCVGLNKSTRIAIISFTLLIVLISQVPLTFAPSSTSTTVASSGTIAYPSAGSANMLKHLVAYSTTITDELASFIGSNFDLVDFDFGGTPDFQKIKSANPSMKIIGYRDFCWMPVWYSDWSIVNQPQNEGWFLHTKFGTTSEYRVMNKADVPNAYAMNPASAGWRNYIATWVSNKLAEYPMVDGIFGDDVGEAIFLNWDPFNVPVGDLSADVVTNWNANMAGLIQTVKNAMGSKLLIINTPDRNGYLMQYCDGQMIEHFLHRSYLAPNDFGGTDPIGYELSLLEKLSATGKTVMAFSGAAIPSSPSSTDIELTHKCMLYTLSGFLLAYSGNAGFGFQSLKTDSTGQKGYWAEMDAPIGTPIGSRYNVQGSLWARDFTNGKVFLNVGDFNTYTVNVAGISYSVAPRSGLIVTS